MMNCVREIRELKCLSQSELAQRAGVSLRTIAYVEKGKKARPATRRKILEGLGMSVQESDHVFIPPTEEARQLRQALRDVGITI